MSKTFKEHWKAKANPQNWLDAVEDLESFLNAYGVAPNLKTQIIELFGNAFRVGDITGLEVGQFMRSQKKK